MSAGLYQGKLRTLDEEADAMMVDIVAALAVGAERLRNCQVPGARRDAPGRERTVPAGKEDYGGFIL